MKYVTIGVRIGWIGENSKSLYRLVVEMEQMMTGLLVEIQTEIRTDQAKADVILEEIRNKGGQRTPARRNAGQVRCPSRNNGSQDEVSAR
jgi:hypothetical protein